MSNTKSPKTRSYRIFRTSNKNHFNGVITLIDFEDNTGLALVYVSEPRPGHDKPVWHVSSEMIEYSQATKEWRTCKPHERQNSNLQDWCFKKILRRTDGLPENLGNDGEDNGVHYDQYITYQFTSASEKNKGTEKRNLQEEDTGTGGNSGE